MTRRAFLLVFLALGGFEPRLPLVQGALQSEPVVRIGLDQAAASVEIRSDTAFRIQQQTTRLARFSTVLALPEGATNQVLTRDRLSYRLSVEMDGGRVLILPLDTRVRIEPGAQGRSGWLQFDERMYRGAMDVWVNARNTFTVVNELPLETYLLGVVPNELSPTTFGEIEALKAQAVAARTYIVRNMGQYASEGYDICDTDACQVYFGAGTEHALATRAVQETRGVIAVYDGEPIHAFYSSTCGGRTEAAENIFEGKYPYLVSVLCEYMHPEPKPFSTSRMIADFREAVLTTAGVSNFTELRRFLGLPGQGEPPSMELTELAAYLRRNFYPNANPVSDVEFMIEQGILSSAGPISVPDILFRMIERKGAFEWQQGVLTDWDGLVMKLTVNNAPREFQVRPDALFFHRIGEERTAVQQGSWIGGELIEFRAANGAIEMAVYRDNFVTPSADRYSRLAEWQTHKTRQELETAFRPLNIGEVRGIRVIQRGASERPVSTEVIGSRGRAVVRALRLRSLLGLRDSLFYFDEERNAAGELIGMSFYGRGWGHGVGMCQVGAYGMALDGATYDTILKTYYQGIELEKRFQ